MRIFLIIATLLISACSSDAPKRGPKKSFEPKVVSKEFPDQSSGSFEYVVAVRMPEVKGMTKVEAEKIRKFHVLNGLNTGLGVLFSLTNPNLQDPKDVDSFFTEVKDDGKTYPTLVYAPTPEIAERQHMWVKHHSPEMENIYLNTHTNRLKAEFRELNQDPEIRPSTVTNIEPNQKLLELFESSGPNVSPTTIKKMSDAIKSKLEPYNIHIIPSNEGGNEFTSRAPLHFSNEGNKKPDWLTNVDKAVGSEIWGFILLYHAKIEPQPKTDPGMVLFKITVNMDDVLKSVKAEKYDDYMAK